MDRVSKLFVELNTAAVVEFSSEDINNVIFLVFGFNLSLIGFGGVEGKG